MSTYPMSLVASRVGMASMIWFFVLGIGTLGDPRQKLTRGDFSTCEVFLDVSAKRKLQHVHVNMSDELSR